MPAGHVLIVGFVTLFVGTLLNAPGIQKTALGQPVGWRRDVATAFADPLYDISHALFLDRPRLALQDLVGRGGDDDVDLTLPGPTSTTPAGTPTTTTTTPKREVFTPERRLRVWIGGDSLAQTPGESVINAAGLLGVVEIPSHGVDTHVATGLARPEVFNWPAYLVEVRDTQAPDVYVLTLGPNDDQSLTGEGGTGPFGSDAWQQEYRRRVGGLMDSVTGDKKHKLFIVGAPIISNVERSETRYKLINEIYKSEAEKRPGLISYIDVYDMFRGPDGGYTDFLTNSDGTVVEVRAGDGIHFTRAGGDRIAEMVLEKLLDVYDLTSWQKSTTTTTAPKTTTTTAPGTPTTKKAGKSSLRGR